MPSTPYAKLLVSLNGSGPVSGGIVTTLGVTVQLSAENTAFWTSQRFEINDYPPGFPCPAGWSTDPNTLAYFWSLSTTPPPFTIPAAVSGGLWGKYTFWLTVNGGLLNGALAVQLVDKSTGLTIYGPGGTHDLAFSETNQFDPVHLWNGDLKHDLRVLDALSNAVSLLGAPSIDPTPLLVSQRDNTGQLRATSFATASTLVADEGALRLQAGPQIAVAMLGVSAAYVPLLAATDAHTIQIGDGNEVTTVVIAPTAAGTVYINGAALQTPYTTALADPGLGNNAILIVAQAAGNGARAGQSFSIYGQPGQNVPTGMGLTNNDGGDVLVAGGPAGTGGTGGNAGKVTIDAFEFHLDQGGGGSDVIAMTSAGLNLATSTGKLGFYAMPPVAQPSSTGDTTQTTAGSGAPVLVDSTTTGGVGTTAYTLSDVVKHIKQLGLSAM